MKTLNDLMVHLTTILQSRVIMLVFIAVTLDTIFGLLRALKERKLNSCFGIDGAIRKITMIVSLAGLALADGFARVNLIGFIPEEARVIIGLDVVGIAQFFAILYICYESVSILKNMYLCGLPVKFVWKAVERFLKKYTDELPEE